MGRRKKYKFWIKSSSLGNLELKYAPKGWNEVGYAWERNMKYHGLFRKYAVSLLQFPKDGKQRVTDVFTNGGVDAEASFLVEFLDTSIQSYIEDFLGELDYSTYKKLRLFSEIGVVDSSFEEKVKNREKIAIDLSKLTSIDGTSIIGFTNEGINVTLPSRIDYAFSNLEADRSAFFTGDHAIPLILLNEEDSDVRTVPDPTAYLNADGAMLVATSDKVLNLTGAIQLGIDFDTDGGQVTIVMNVYDSGGSLQSTTPVFTDNVASGILSIDTTFDKDITMSEGDRLNFAVNLTPVSTAATLTPYIVTCQVRTELENIPTIQVVTLLWHEIFARILQNYTGVNDPFYSDLVGRTDSEPRNYASDGDASLNCGTDGKRLRQFSLSDGPLSFSLEKMFKAVNSLKNVGLGIETISGQKMVRMEKKSHFYQPTVILTFENCKDIEEFVIPDLIYNKIVNGPDKAAYEEREGILEYNNKTEWTNPIKKVGNELNLTSPIRYDNAGITNARKLSKSENPTSDSQYDKDNFFINLVRGTINIVNGNFDDWTTDTDVDDWNHTAAILRLDLLGSNRLQFTGTSGQIDQTFAVTAGDEMFLNFVYKLINETATGNIALAVLVVLDGTYYLRQGGDWSTTLQTLIYDIVEPVKQANVQDFDQYTVKTDAFPVTGNLQIVIFPSASVAGLTIDNVSFTFGRFIARTDEGFDVIENTVNNEKSFNLEFTPARSLDEHGNVFRSFLDKYLNNYMRYVSSENNVNVQSQETGEDLIVENADKLINDFEEPFFDAYGYRMKTPITRAQKDILEGETNNKPSVYAIIKFRRNSNDTYKFGWIKIVNILTRNDRNQAEFELLKVSDEVVIS